MRKNRLSLSPQKASVQRTARHERGQSMVELGIGMVVLLILVAGIADFGRIFFTYVVLRDAAEEGAIYGSIYPTDYNEIVARVRDASRQPVDLSDPDILVIPTFTGGACANGSNGIQVIVRHTNFLLATPFMGTLVGSQSISFEAVVTNTILSPPC